MDSLWIPIKKRIPTENCDCMATIKIIETTYNSETMERISLDERTEYVDTVEFDSKYSRWKLYPDYGYGGDHLAYITQYVNDTLGEDESGIYYSLSQDGYWSCKQLDKRSKTIDIIEIYLLAWYPIPSEEYEEELLTEV